MNIILVLSVLFWDTWVLHFGLDLNQKNHRFSDMGFCVALPSIHTIWYSTLCICYMTILCNHIYLRKIILFPGSFHLIMFRMLIRSLKSVMFPIAHFSLIFEFCKYFLSLNLSCTKCIHSQYKYHPKLHQLMLWLPLLMRMWKVSCQFIKETRIVIFIAVNNSCKIDVFNIFLWINTILWAYILGKIIFQYLIIIGSST